MCDLVPPFVQYESMLSYLDKLGEKMYHFHIIDGEQGTDNHIIPGEGAIPLRELFIELKEANYQELLLWSWLMDILMSQTVC